MEPKNNQEKKKDIAAFWKKVLFHNLSIKILSFLGALLVWLFIVNIDDPYKTKSYMVHVDLTNEDALRSVHKVYEIVEGGTATVRVRGRRSVVDNLDASDIKATADLSELSAVNSVDIKPSLKIATSSDVELECTQVLKVSLEDMETKQVKVTVETEGTPAEGYTVGSCNAKPNVIEVSGGESVIDRIATVKVTLNVNGASDSFLKNLEPVMLCYVTSFSYVLLRLKPRLAVPSSAPGPPDYEKLTAKCRELLNDIGGMGDAFKLHQWEDLLAPKPPPSSPSPSASDKEPETAAKDGKTAADKPSETPSSTSSPTPSSTSAPAAP